MLASACAPFIGERVGVGTERIIARSRMSGEASFVVN